MCKLKRNCPTCGKELCYTNKYTLKTAEIKKSNCKSCGLKKTMTKERLEQMSERVKGKNNPMYGKFGDKNPFFGKTHTDKTKRLMSENKDTSVYKTDEFREKMSKVTSGKKNGMFGRSFYDVWLDKYGKEIADEKMIKHKEKLSINSSGEKNPMYGKPSPKGSGNGWSGWYKGWFFRSIKELTYMIKVIERFRLKWEDGENKKFSIDYVDYKGNKRTYRPDFIINNKYMVEIKPKNLWNSDMVTRKKISAQKFCKTNGLIYKLVDITPLNYDEIFKRYLKKEIQFIDRYEEKYRRMCN